MRYCAKPGAVFVDEDGKKYILEKTDVWSLATLTKGVTVRNILGKSDTISPMFVMKVGGLKFGVRSLRTKLN